MSRRATVWSLVAVVLLACLLWLAGLGGGGSSQKAAPPPVATGRGAAARVGEATVQRPAGEQPARQALAAADPGGEQAGAPAELTAQLRIRVLDASTGEPAPGAVVWVRDLSTDPSWPTLTARPVGPEGLRVAVPVGHRLAAQVPPLESPYGAVFQRVEPLEPGEDREVILRVDLVPAFTGKVRVLDQDRRPVPGARVTPVRAGLFPAVRTGPDGLAVLPELRDPWGTEVRVAKEGHATAFAGVRPYRPEVEVVLVPERILQGRALGPDSRPRPGARVRLRGERVVFVETPGRFPAWETTAGADGSFRLDGLPAGASLWLVASSGEASCAEVLPPLPPGITERELFLRASPVLAGVVLDEAGDPVAGVEVEVEPLLALAAAGGWLPGVDLARSERREARTGPDGRFRFGSRARLLPGSWRVGLAGSLDESRPGAEEGAAYAFLPVEERVELVPGGETEVVLRARRGLTIRGFLLDDLGEPLPDGYVEAWPARDAPPSVPRIGIETVVHSADGAFVLGPLFPCRYRLRGGDPARALEGRLEDVEAGVDGVLLRCRPRSGLRIHVLDQDGRERDARVLVRERSRRARVWVAGRETQGWYTLRIPGGEVDLLAHTDGGLVGYALAVGVEHGRSREVILRLEPGAAVRISLGGLETEGRTAELWHRGVRVYAGRAAGLGWWSRLPLGEVRLRLLAGGRVQAEAAGVVRPGEDLVLAPAPPPGDRPDGGSGQR